jgi:hypothetical protein
MGASKCLKEGSSDGCLLACFGIGKTSAVVSLAFTTEGNWKMPPMGTYIVQLLARAVAHCAVHISPTEGYRILRNRVLRERFERFEEGFQPLAQD